MLYFVYSSSGCSLKTTSVSTTTSYSGPKTTRLLSCPPSSNIEEFRRRQYSISPCHISGGSFSPPDSSLRLALLVSADLVKGSLHKHVRYFPNNIRRKHGPVPILLTRRPLKRLDRTGSFSRGFVTSERGRFQVILYYVSEPQGRGKSSRKFMCETSEKSELPSKSAQQFTTKNANQALLGTQ